jgi:hypothetical protein
MKTYLSSNVLVREETGTSFFQKLIVASLIIALLVASLPVHAAFAATSSTNNYAQEWSDKLATLRNNGIFYERVRVYPADFEDLNELALAHQYLNDYGAALRTAQRIAINHAGFNQKGKVVNDELANKSLKDLSENLRLMRVSKEKLNRLEGDYRLLPVGAVTTTASQ